MKFKTALFDFDGVIVDTEPIYDIFWNEAGERYGTGIDNFAAVIKGTTLPYIMEKYFSDRTEEFRRMVINESTEYESTLYRLARVFGITAAELLNLAEARLSHPLKATAHRNEDFLFREINYKNIRCLHGRAGKGSRVSHPNVHRDDYELCWILDGTLRLTLPSESYELSAGQSLQFDALLEHTYEALTDCELLILHIRKENRF